MKKLLLLVGIITKHEIEYEQLIVNGKTATLKFCSSASENMYDEFKEECLSSGFKVETKRAVNSIVIIEK